MAANATAAIPPKMSREAVVVYFDNTEPAIEFSAQQLQKTQVFMHRQSLELQNLNERLGAAHLALGAIRSSPMYRVFRAIGRWRWIDAVFARAFPDEAKERAAVVHKKKTRTCVAIDLTPLLPGGDNGGAKLVAVALVKQLARLMP